MSNVALKFAKFQFTATMVKIFSFLSLLGLAHKTNAFLGTILICSLIKFHPELLVIIM